MLTGAGLVDATANPVIHFASTWLRPGDGGMRVDGRLVTKTGGLELTLSLAEPAALAPGRVGFRVRGSLPSSRAARLLAHPGVERLLDPNMRLDLIVEALAPAS
ncbi:MAG: hypothetical protein GEU83_02905 [Pseudonocardiaceae bacterium]|nr:hypothetical protein [Pseudonocardiaceae bacterium]